jgi:hypothetical protein
VTAAIKGDNIRKYRSRDERCCSWRATEQTIRDDLRDRLSKNLTSGWKFAKPIHDAKRVGDTKTVARIEAQEKRELKAWLAPLAALGQCSRRRRKAREEKLRKRRAMTSF